MNSVVPLKKKFASKVVLSCQAVSCQIAEVARKAEDGRGPWIPSFVPSQVLLVGRSSKFRFV